MSETDWKSKPENKTSLYQLNGCNVVFPSDLASSNSNNDIFLDLQKTSHILPIPIPFLCLFSTLFTMLSQYLLMLQALYTCLIYAPCISLSSSPELIPCEFSEAFLKKTSFSRSTSLCGQHHMWRAHSNCYTSRPTNSLAEDEKQNSVLAISFFSYTQSYYVCALSMLTLVSFLPMSHSEVRRARKAVEVGVLFVFVQLGFFFLCEKHQTEDQEKHTSFWFWLRSHILWRCLCTILADLTLSDTSVGRLYGC